MPASNPRDRWADGSVHFRDNAATRALATMLPYINRAGASARRVRDAIDHPVRFQSLDQLLRAAAINRDALLTHVKVVRGESNVSERWREAEEIAALADALLGNPDNGLPRTRRPASHTSRRSASQRAL